MIDLIILKFSLKGKMNAGLILISIYFFSIKYFLLF